MKKIIKFIDNIGWEIWLFNVMIESELNRHRLERIRKRIIRKAEQNDTKNKEKV